MRHSQLLESEGNLPRNHSRRHRSFQRVLPQIAHKAFPRTLAIGQKHGDALRQRAVRRQLSLSQKMVRNFLSQRSSCQVVRRRGRIATASLGNHPAIPFSDGLRIRRQQSDNAEKPGFLKSVLPLFFTKRLPSSSPARRPKQAKTGPKPDRFATLSKLSPPSFRKNEWPEDSNQEPPIQISRTHFERRLWPDSEASARRNPVSETPFSHTSLPNTNPVALERLKS